MKKSILLTFMAMCLALTGMAVPAKPGPMVYKQPDGSFLTFYLKGDENACISITSDGYALSTDADGWMRYAKLSDEGIMSIEGSPVAHNIESRDISEQQFLEGLAKPDVQRFFSMKTNERIAKAASRPVAKAGKFPSTGEIRGLVLLVEFQNNSFYYDKDYHERMMNETGFSEDGNFGSARDYFLCQSAEKFQPTFDVIGPIKLSKRISYYGNDGTSLDTKGGVMVEEACKLAHDNFGCDFSKYDYDNDGKVDMVYIIYAGYGQNAGAPSYTLWPLKSDLSSKGINLNLDGKKVDTYAYSAELASSVGKTSNSIGVFCHEFSHVLGLPDMYQTNYTSFYAVDNFDILATGCYNNNNRNPPCFSALERYWLGWLVPEEPTTPQRSVRHLPMQNSNTAVKLNTDNPDEYFFLENRPLTGWDEYLPSGGLLISHVKFNVSNWTNNTFNNYAESPGVCIVPADNDRSLYTEDDDTYPGKNGNNAFTDESTPASLTWSGNKLDKWVENIRLDGTDIVYDFMANHQTGIEDVTAGDGSWFEVDGRSIKLAATDGDASFTIYNAAGAKVYGVTVKKGNDVNVTMPYGGYYVITDGIKSAKVILR